MEERVCNTCYFCETYPGEEPCVRCKPGERDEWKPIKPGDVVYRGFDPGAPEGDKTNVRLDWGESGPELIGPQDITSMDQLKDGPLAETARAYLKQITRLDYAIEGVRSKMSSIGLKFTDKDLSRDEIDFQVGQLNALQLDLFELENEREAMMKGGGACQRP